MKLNLTNPLMSPDGGQGNGGAAGAGDQGTAASIFSEGASGDQGQGQGQQQASGDGQQQQTAGANGQAAAGAGAATPPPTMLTLEQVQGLMKNIPMQQQQQQQTPQLTEAEFNKLFNVYTPDETLVQALRSEDPKQVIAGLQAAFQAIVRQASTVSAYHMSQEAQRLEAQFAPALKVAQEQELTAMKAEFFDKYPNLKGLEPLLLQIRDSFRANGRSFASKEEAFKAVADEAGSLVKKIPGLEAALSQQGAGGVNGATGGNGQQGRRMPTLSGKGQGGGVGGQGGGQQQVSTAQRIFS